MPIKGNTDLQKMLWFWASSYVGPPC